MTIPDGTADGAEVMAAFIPASPLVGLLGITVGSLGDGEATLLLPYRPELTTIGETVHGGAIRTGRSTPTTTEPAAPVGLEGPTIGDLRDRPPGRAGGS